MWTYLANLSTEKSIQQIYQIFLVYLSDLVYLSGVFLSSKSINIFLVYLSEYTHGNLVHQALTSAITKSFNQHGNHS